MNMNIDVHCLCCRLEVSVSVRQTPGADSVTLVCQASTICWPPILLGVRTVPVTQMAQSMGMYHVRPKQAPVTASRTLEV